MILMLALVRAGAREEGADRAGTLELGPIPEAAVVSTPPSEARQREIRGWIRQFAEIGGSGVGFSPSITGSAFAPHPGSERTGMALLGQAPPSPPEAFRKVVEAGADALPLLLHHLSDPTPTKYVARFGRMNLRYQTEMDYNPATGEKPAPEKTSARSNLRPGYFLVQDAEPASRSHAVCVGEICFVAIGQIVNRSFNAMRYQPSGNIYVNSPIQSPELAAAVRANWSAVADRAGLFLRLRQDFATRSRSGPEADREALGRQIEAARRLLFYFPKESDAFVATRMRALAKSDGQSAVMTEFAAAVAISPPPETARVLVEWARSAKDAELWIQVARELGKVDRGLAAQRTEAFLRDTKSRETGALLALYVGLAEEKAARAALDRVLKGKAEGVEDALSALSAEKPKWAEDVLVRLFEDKREIPRWRVRVCDLAAATLADLDPTLPYERQRELAARDEQLARLKRALAERKKKP